MPRKPAWIETVPESEAEGPLADAYKAAADPATGEVDHIMKVHSLHPRSLQYHQHLYATLMKGAGPLSRTQREMIGVVVSALNQCHY
jgi:alkylhydroperoxidase family enzyme